MNSGFFCLSPVPGGAEVAGQAVDEAADKILVGLILVADIKIGNQVFTNVNVGQGTFSLS